MRATTYLALAASWLGATPALAATEPAPGPAADDPVLASLIEEAMQKRPELLQAQALTRAERERVPQARALPDPVLSLGIQNDGFKSIEIGKMETSYYSIGASQTLPWFGKRGLRAEVADLQARQAEADQARARLSVEAEVRRAYLDLLLARDELKLLARLEALWIQSEGLARTRYEAGQGAQSDILRAQLERSRLKQRRWVLEAEERRRREALNRACVRPLDAPVETTRSLRDLPDPELPDREQALADAEARSPELARALAAGQQAERRLDLARKDYFPDFTVSAGVMPRGALDPMWQAGLSFSIPLWAGSKQSRAVAENESRSQAGLQGADAVRQLLRLRVEERLAVLSGLLETNRLYRAGILVQSDATTSSTLAQYRVGRVTFASVLEALVGYLSDVDGFFNSVAAAQRIAIAQREVSLDSVSGGGAGMGTTPVPGAGATRGSSGATGAPAGQPAEAASAGMSRM